MTYRVGIVGASFGEKVHLPSFFSHPAFEVVAIASPNSAGRIAKERGIPNAYDNAAEMIAGAELDVVSIASPPFTHHADVLAALAAGKHVLCEKPFTLNLSQAQELVDAEQRAGTACAVMHEFRWVPQRIAIKELIANNHLTPLRHIEITQLMGFLRADATRKGNWWFEKERGGGLAGALLSHLIDTANWLAGRPPVWSTGMVRTANPRRHDTEKAFESTVDDGAFALIDYGEGLVARVTADATVGVESFVLGAHGEHRTAVASGSSMTDMRLFSVDADETNELDCAPMKYAKFESVNPHVPLVLELLDEFVKQIETGTSAVPTFKDALETQRVLESIGYTTP
ncbi:MAG: Gfo/Idh/MocA family oxidoreductase [Candidatus Eremiobacteraeota bacterium]|nr:Gfo/Idh/MocA family oxidoreductase [Candidatus Eremiobacteraeota bacterium]